jgi:HSP20 family protein
MLWTETFSPFTWQLGRTAFHPAADVTISDNDVVLTLDLPGLTADDVEIELVDGYLAVRGERRRPELPDGSRNAHSERGYGRFERRIALPDGVDPDAITASMDNGVLSLIVPKPDRMVRRTIAIGGGQRELEPAGS